MSALSFQQIVIYSCRFPSRVNFCSWVSVGISQNNLYSPVPPVLEKRFVVCPLLSSLRNPERAVDFSISSAFYLLLGCSGDFQGPCTWHWKWKLNCVFISVLLHCFLEILLENTQLNGEMYWDLETDHLIWILSLLFANWICLGNSDFSFFSYKKWNENKIHWFGLWIEWEHLYPDDSSVPLT